MQKLDIVIIIFLSMLCLTFLLQEILGAEVPSKARRRGEATCVQEQLTLTHLAETKNLVKNAKN